MAGVARWRRSDVRLMWVLMDGLSHASLGPRTFYNLPYRAPSLMPKLSVCIQTIEWAAIVCVVFGTGSSVVLLAALELLDILLVVSHTADAPPEPA